MKRNHPRVARASVKRVERATMEYVSFEGLRLDGRRANEIRRPRHAFAIDAQCDGSARFELGNTVIECRVDGPSERKFGGAEEGASEACALTCSHGRSAFASDGVQAGRKGDGRSKQFESVLAKALTSAVCVDLMPRCEVQVRTTVLCDDGGARAASACAAVLALADAGIPLKGIIGSCTVGHLDGEALIDVNRDEERGRGPELWTCALSAGDVPDDDENEDDGEDHLMGATGNHITVIVEELERGKTTMETFKSMHDLALAGCETSARYLRISLRALTRALAATRALEKF